MTLNGGDTLARGGKSATFAAGGDNRDAPVELKNVAPEEETFGVTVIDRRPSYLDSVLQSAEPINPVELKYPEKEYSAYTPILDRILVKRVLIDKGFEPLSDGSLRNVKTGMIIPFSYRQHNNVGVVLATGSFFVISGVRIPMEDIVRPGDLVTFGEYNTEKVVLPEEEAQALCDAVQSNYEKDEELNLVYVQNVRSVRRPVAVELEAGMGGFDSQ